MDIKNEQTREKQWILSSQFFFDGPPRYTDNIVVAYTWDEKNKRYDISSAEWENKLQDIKTGTIIFTPIFRSRRHRSKVENMLNLEGARWEEQDKTT